MTKRRDLLIGLALALLVAALLSPLASSAPDGLEWVATQLGFVTRAPETPVLTSPLPDYTVPSVTHGWVSTAAAGVIGTLVVAGALVGLGRLIRRSESPEGPTHRDASA